MNERMANVPVRAPRKNTTYRKPVMTTRVIELGVFGDYGGDTGASEEPFMPISYVRSNELRLE